MPEQLIIYKDKLKNATTPECDDQQRQYLERIFISRPSCIIAEVEWNSYQHGLSIIRIFGKRNRRSLT